MQIVDYVCDRVLRDEIKPDEQIPSVRELAVQLEVNPNTVMRAIERMLQAEIIYSQRGKGNFLAAGAKELIIHQRTKQLLEERLPQLAEEITLLNISPDEVAENLKNIIKSK